MIVSASLLACCLWWCLETSIPEICNQCQLLWDGPHLLPFPLVSPHFLLFTHVFGNCPPPALLSWLPPEFHQDGYYGNHLLEVTSLIS